ncbi:MAG: tetratricopeptide repeat protein [Legionellales bacterium]|nr:tetratricopeptide repeat protein [Legionellales bacterium]
MTRETKHAANHQQKGWALFSVDMMIKNQPVDTYFLMDLDRGLMLGFEIIIQDLTPSIVNMLLLNGEKTVNSMPDCLVVSSSEPFKSPIQEASQQLGIEMKELFFSVFEEMILPVKKHMAENFFSPSFLFLQPSHRQDEQDRECAKQLFPASYEPCSCGSGSKYKFCCKRIFKEIVEAMVAAEEGKLSKALSFLDEAEQVVGTTAEILCRRSIVYSFFNDDKSVEFLKACLMLNPNHPRANYLLGIDLKESHQYEAAIEAYQKAISFYPPTDKFHLNEVYNNLGCTYHAMGDIENAKLAWEKALALFPQDKATQANLRDFIYNGADSEASLIVSPSTDYH